MKSEPEILLHASRFRVERRLQKLPDGTMRPREVVVHPGAVVIVPLLDDGRLCFIENYRIAVEQTLLEFPAGTIDPGEDPAVTAPRELAEETGYQARKWQKLGEFFMSPGILNERMHVYLAKDLTPGPTALELGEQITSRLTTVEEALEMIDRGEIVDAKTLAALLLYQRQR
jgi:ADP-ribose pyrophosphatase